MAVHFSSLEDKVHPIHTALIVVDVQRDFCAPDGEYARRDNDISMMLEMTPRLAELINAAKANDVLVIFLRGIEGVEDTVSDAWYELVARHTSDDKRLLCRVGTRGAEFFPPVVPSENDIVITKYRYSGFSGTNLDLILRSKNILTVVVTGVVTEVCVEATVRSACDLDYRTVVVEDCTASTNRTAHEDALNRMAHICADRTTSTSLMAIWGKV